MQHIAWEKEEEKTPNLFGTRTNRPDSPAHTVDMTNRSLFSTERRRILYDHHYLPTVILLLLVLHHPLTLSL